MMHSHIVPPNTRGVLACLAAALALGGCAGTLPPLPNDEVRTKLATAGVTIHPYTGTTAIGTPLRGWQAVGEAAKQGIAAPVCGRDPCPPSNVSIGGGGPLEGFVIGLALLWIPVGGTAGAISGALNSHSEQEIETGVSSFRHFEETFEPDRQLQEQLLTAAAKIAEGPRLMFANSSTDMHVPEATGEQQDKDAPARSGNVLLIESGYSICSHGKISPDISMIFTEEATLTGVDSALGFHRRWELVTHSINYFDAMADNAKLLHAEFASAYAKLAERMVNDLYVPTTVNKNNNSGQGFVRAVAEGKPFETCD